MKIENQTQCQDLARGACLLGVGGGGLPALGLPLLLEDLSSGRTHSLVSVEEIPDDALTCCAWGMGSIAPKDAAEVDRQLVALGVPPERSQRHMVSAVRALEKLAGRKVDVIIPFEPGGRVMPSALSTASVLGIPMSDGDYSGRAVPELNQLMTSVAGHSPAPAVAVDQFGNITALLTTVSNPMAERIGKHLAMAAFGSVAMAGFLLPGKTARKLIIPGTVSRAIRIGKAIREANASGADPVAAAAQSVGGEIVFHGKLRDREWRDDNGYMIGTMHLCDSNGNTMSIWFKNENHVASLNDVPIATSPDLISVVDAVSGEPYTNGHKEITEASALVVIVSPAPDRLKQPDALKFHEPRWYGVDIAYKPFVLKQVTT